MCTLVCLNVHQHDYTSKIFDPILTYNFTLFFLYELYNIKTCKNDVI